MAENNKKVLITGASSGMGYEAAKLLSSLGFTVYAGSRTPHKLKDIESNNLIPILLDISKSESIKDSMDILEDIDILVNNAGYGLISTVEDVEEKQMIDQFDINVFGALRVTQAVVPGMRVKRNGIIINISSFLGKVGLPLLTFYNASKYALEGITDSLRHELRPFGIRVHSVMPGFFDTNFARDNLVINKKTFLDSSAYKDMVDTLTPAITKQINEGNDPADVANIIRQIIENEDFPARVTAGDKSAKFIPMRRELSDEDFEQRVEEYYDLEGL